MRQTANRLILGLLLLVAVSASTLAQASNPVIGTWKLNLAKSKYDPGPAPRSQTRTAEDRGGGVMHFTDEGFDAQSQPTFTQFALKYDGKDYPTLIRGAQTAASQSCKSSDPYTADCTQKEDGKVTTTSTRTVSRDGKTMTVFFKGRNAQGQPVNNVIVFDRQ